MRPAFWGVEKDLKEVIDSMENAWNSKPSLEANEFKENEQAFFISMDIPGVKKDDLDIQIEGDHIVVNGLRKKSLSSDEGVERKITQIFLLPKHVDREKIEAHVEDGVLYLALPKAEKEKPKKINILEGQNFFQKLEGKSQS